LLRLTEFTPFLGELAFDKLLFDNFERMDLGGTGSVGSPCAE
jgi:hypothetical protein